MIGELEEIKMKYERGLLDPIREDLKRFIATHRIEIQRFQTKRGRLGATEMTDELAIKLYIIRHRTINPAREIQEQLEEIKREKWIRGEKLGREPDAQQVALEWSRQHSAGWRAHRVTSIIYVFERNREEYLRLYRGEGQ
jgi:hypothetical protein